MSGNKFLFGAFLTSFTYLSYKIYEKLSPNDHSLPEGSENYLIIKRMNERLQSGHLQDTPFPTYLETGRQPPVTTSRNSLCESIQMQLERDWNSFLYHMSKLVLK